MTNRQFLEKMLDQTLATIEHKKKMGRDVESMVVIQDRCLDDYLYHKRKGTLDKERDIVERIGVGG